MPSGMANRDFVRVKSVMSFPGRRPGGIIRADIDYFKLKIYGWDVNFPV
jgi:hypothetical protein